MSGNNIGPLGSPGNPIFHPDPIEKAKKKEDFLAEVAKLDQEQSKTSSTVGKAALSFLALFHTGSKFKMDMAMRGVLENRPEGAKIPTKQELITESRLFKKAKDLEIQLKGSRGDIELDWARKKAFDALHNYQMKIYGLADLD